MRECNKLRDKLLTQLLDKADLFRQLKVEMETVYEYKYVLPYDTGDGQICGQKPLKDILFLVKEHYIEDVEIWIESEVKDE